MKRLFLEILYFFLWFLVFIMIYLKLDVNNKENPFFGGGVKA